VTFLKKPSRERRVVMARALVITIAAAVLALALALPASANPGGLPNPAGDCGLGVPLAFAGINDPSHPGASDFATIAPNSVGCTGQP
jgi:hypothetical protein